MIVHTADFNGGAKEFDVARVWSEKVNLEFVAQYALEGSLGLPQTPFLKGLDNSQTLAKSEMNFSKVIVRPLWVALNAFCSREGDELEVSVTNLDNTIISWEKLANTIE
jgi:hypothetical protein